jgi:DNA-binding response OmpR family regulator
MTRQILIAEDDLALQEFFAKAFRNAEFEVIVVDDGHAVLDHLAENTPDILMLDIGLPGKNGMEIMRQVRHAEDLQRHLEDHQPINIIVVTGNDLLENMPEAQLADLFLIKPVSIYQLLALAERLSYPAA